MKVMTGTVVDGKVVIEGESLTNGSKVTILAPEAEGETFELSPEQEHLLRQSINEIERGEGIDAGEFLGKLGKTD